jgi:4-hydroxy-3-polyprenylbenzoate decarboxylase
MVRPPLPLRLSIVAAKIAVASVALSNGPSVGDHPKHSCLFAASFSSGLWGFGYNAACMSHASLADFIEDLEQAGDLVRVAAPVSAELEIAAIANRAGAGGPALLFERVAGHHTPVATNLLGSEARICRALAAASVDELAERLAVAGPLAAEGWRDRFKSRPPSDRLAPKMLKSGVCQQVVMLGRDVDFGHWPALRSWPEERQPTITAACLVSLDPLTQTAGIESPPLVVLGRNKLGVVWHRYQRSYAHFKHFRAAGQRMPVAAWLGGPPACSLAAAAPLPAEVDAWQFSALLSEPLELVKCRSLDLAVPATAEIVLEGYIDPAEPPVEVGPVALSNGYYAVASAQPLEVVAVSHRSNPIFVGRVPCAPPSEHSALASVIARLWLPVARRLAPELVDFAPAQHAGVGETLVVAIRKQHPRQAQKVAAALWGSDWLMFAKAIVVVDAEIDVRDGAQVLLAIGAHVDPGRDLFFQDGPSHPFDHAAWPAGEGRALGIDATAKLPEERAGPRPHRLIVGDGVTEMLDRRWQEYGIGGV